MQVEQLEALATFGNRAHEAAFIADFGIDG
jgi:hypothetical protein